MGIVWRVGRDLETEIGLAKANCNSSLDLTAGHVATFVVSPYPVQARSEQAMPLLLLLLFGLAFGLDMHLGHFFSITGGSYSFFAVTITLSPASEAFHVIWPSKNACMFDKQPKGHTEWSWVRVVTRSYRIYD